MKLKLFIITCIATALLTVGCAAKYQTVRVPPRVDLAEHELIAVVEFDSNGDADLGPLATRRFTDLARRDQGTIRMLRIDDPETARRDATAMREVGERHGARTLFVGRVEISDVRPKVSIAQSLSSGSIAALIDAVLTVDLVETETGASLWSASARATREVGHVALLDGKHVTFDAEDPEQAYGPLIEALVGQVTSDFQARWVRQPIPR